MTYTVIGFRSGTMDTAQLHVAIVKRGYSHLVSNIKVLSVRSDDFDALSSRFGREFVNFILLNDVAVEVCQAVGFPIIKLGTIDETEVGNPLPLLGILE